MTRRPAPPSSMSGRPSTRCRRPFLLAVALAAGLAGGGNPAAGEPVSLTATRVASDLFAAVFAASPPGDSRLFAADRAGRILALDPATGELDPTPLLDIAASVDTEGEGGLLGLAFASDWPETGVFYVYYTSSGPDADHPLTSRLSRFVDQGDPAATAATETVLFSLDQPFANHNGGTVAFGADGALYLGLGDGGGAGDPDDRAQDSESRFGKLLRFDPSGEPPLTPTVVALGLRNPFRFSFDRLTGDLYLGDVGQGAREEIDVVAAGVVESLGDAGATLNFGWDVLEGTLEFDPDPDEPAPGAPELVPPVHEYVHEDPPCGGSVTGGVVYRGQAIPGLVGAYLFGDFCTGRIWTLRWDGMGGIEPGSLVERTGELVPDARSIDGPVAFAEDAAGEILVVDVDGEIFRVPEPRGPVNLGAALATLGLLARLRRCRP